MKKLFIGLAVCLMVISIHAAALDVTINEIMYNPPAAMGDDTDLEYVELFNPLPTAIDLTGWKLECGGMNTTISDVQIPTSGYLVVARELDDGTDADTDCFSCYYNWAANAIDGVGWTLRNTNDVVRLFDNNGNVVSRVAYSSIWGANGDGASLEKINVYASDDSQSNWAPSIDTDAIWQSGKSDGTPDELNSVSTSSIPEFSTTTAIAALVLSASTVLIIKKRETVKK